MIGYYIILGVFLVLYIIMLRERIKYIRFYNNLSVFDGLFFGGLFFTIIPLFYSLFFGDISIFDTIFFNTHRDTSLVVYILLSNLFFGLSSLLLSRKFNFSSFKITSFEVNFFTFVVLLYFISLIVIFLSSGKLDGDSHWYRGNSEIYSRGSFFVLLGQFHNVGRVIIPGMCLFFQLKYLKIGKIFKFHFYLALIIIPLELILAGNRIVILFFVFSILIPFFIYGFYKKIILYGLIFLPLVVVSKFWPIVRGMLWSEQVSVERFVEIIEVAYYTEFNNPSEIKVDPVIVVTEGSNLAALNYVWKDFPMNKNFTMGNTLIFKSFGTLIPKSIWSDKPDGIGHEVGENVVSGISLYLNVTILGDAWSNFGWFGCVYIIFILSIFTYFIKFFNPMEFNFISIIAFMVSIASWRFEFSFYFISMYTFIIYFFLLRISIVKRICNQFGLYIFSNFY